MANCIYNYIKPCVLSVSPIAAFDQTLSARMVSSIQRARDALEKVLDILEASDAQTCLTPQQLAPFLDEQDKYVSTSVVQFKQLTHWVLSLQATPRIGPGTSHRGWSLCSAMGIISVSGDL